MGWEADSDTLVVVGTGLLAIVVFVVSAVIVQRTGFVQFGPREMAGLIAGFTIFMCIYFVSMSLHRVL